MNVVKILLLIGLVSLNVEAKENIQWQQGEVLPLELSLNKERKIAFPEPVKFGFKKKYQAFMSHSLIDNVFFITAKVKFDEKLTFQGLMTNRVYLFQGHVGDSQDVVSDVVVHIKEPNMPESSQINNAQSLVQEKITPVDLVQFASQSLYAPNEGLIEATPGIRRVPVKQISVPNLYQGGDFSATVLAGWQGGKFYVTAVKLQNNSNRAVMFNPCKVRGKFYSSTAQFKSAFPKGHRADFTVVYFLSELPFGAAVHKGHLQCV